MGLCLFLILQILVVVILLKKNSWIMQIDRGVEKIAEGAEDYQIDVKEMYSGKIIGGAYQSDGGRISGCCPVCYKE